MQGQLLVVQENMKQVYQAQDPMPHFFMHTLYFECFYLYMRYMAEQVCLYLS